MDGTGSGWRFFAGTVLGIAGIMRFFDAIWAWRYHGAIPNDLEAAIFGHSLKTYGWVYFIVAIILIGSSFGVVVGSQFSRWIGIIAVPDFGRRWPTSRNASGSAPATVVSTLD
jgi:hypothetical protein